MKANYRERSNSGDRVGGRVQELDDSMLTPIIKNSKKQKAITITGKKSSRINISAYITTISDNERNSQAKHRRGISRNDDIYNGDNTVADSDDSDNNSETEVGIRDQIPYKES